MSKWLPVAMLSVLVALAQASEQEQPTCTLTVQPEQSIQAAIDSVPEGAVICMSANNFPYTEHLTITKSLTLRGAGRDKTFLTGKEIGDKPIIHIKGDKPIEVILEDFTESWMPGSEFLPGLYGVYVQGQAKVAIRNMEIRRNSHGIVVTDTAQLQLDNVDIHWNTWRGLLVLNSAEVTIRNSLIRETGYADGIFVGHSARMTLVDTTVSDNDRGLTVAGSARVTISESRFVNNSWCGLTVATAEAQVLGPPQEFQGNGADLCGFAPASLRKPLAPQTEKTELTVPGDYANLQEAIDAIAPGGMITIAPGIYEVGLTLWKPVTLRGAGPEQTLLKALTGRGLVGSMIAGIAGIQLENLAITTEGQGSALLIAGQGRLSNVKIFDNGFDGLAIFGPAVFEVQSSTIVGNGTFPECSMGWVICNGIALSGQAQLKLTDSVIRENWDWGLAAALTQCGFPYDAFTGTVTFEGTNIIEGNSRWGNQKGIGNPGSHPWNNPAVPDGQVCLP
jgi:nitrous oxidase accessory protein NosD